MYVYIYIYIYTHITTHVYVYVSSAKNPQIAAPRAALPCVHGGSRAAETICCCFLFSFFLLHAASSTEQLTSADCQQPEINQKTKTHKETIVCIMFCNAMLC